MNIVVNNYSRVESFKKWLKSKEPKFLSQISKFHRLQKNAFSQPLYQIVSLFSFSSLLATEFFWAVKN